MPLTRVELEHFTAFAKLGLDLSPGINVLVGANGSGKTHLMKVWYAACDAYLKVTKFSDKDIGVFLAFRSLDRPTRHAVREAALARSSECFVEHIAYTCGFPIMLRRRHISPHNRCQNLERRVDP